MPNCLDVSAIAQSYLLRNSPQRLMLVASGNIGNTELERLIIAALPLMALRIF